MKQVFYNILKQSYIKLGIEKGLLSNYYNHRDYVEFYDKIFDVDVLNRTIKTPFGKFKIDDVLDMSVYNNFWNDVDDIINSMDKIKLCMMYNSDKRIKIQIIQKLSKDISFNLSDITDLFLKDITETDIESNKLYNTVFFSLYYKDICFEYFLKNKYKFDKRWSDEFIQSVLKYFIQKAVESNISYNDFMKHIDKKDILNDYYAKFLKLMYYYDDFKNDNDEYDITNMILKNKFLNNKFDGNKNGLYRLLDDNYKNIIVDTYANFMSVFESISDARYCSKFSELIKYENEKRNIIGHEELVKLYPSLRKFYFSLDECSDLELFQSDNIHNNYGYYEKEFRKCISKIEDLRKFDDSMINNFVDNTAFVLANCDDKIYDSNLERLFNNKSYINSHELLAKIINDYYIEEKIVYNKTYGNAITLERIKKLFNCFSDNKDMLEYITRVLYNRYKYAVDNDFIKIVNELNPIIRQNVFKRIGIYNVLYNRYNINDDDLLACMVDKLNFLSSDFEELYNNESIIKLFKQVMNETILDIYDIFPKTINYLKMMNLL